jgi:YHS domain-containing protein
MCCCNKPEKVAGNVKDPVCGMIVDPANAARASEYQGVTYSFCCARCKRKFDSAPDQYSALPTLPQGGGK